MGTIKETFALIASNADILAAPSRLAAIPQNGVMTIEVSARQSDATNFGTITLLLPNGDIPFEDLIVPASGGAVAANDILDSRTQLTVVFPVEKGGHVLYSLTENGAIQFFSIVTLTF